MAVAETPIETDEDIQAGTGPVVAAYLLVQVGVFVGLVWKWWYFYLADQVYHAWPLADSFFPAWFQSAESVRWAYLIAVGSIVLGVAGMLASIRMVCAAAQVLALAFLLVHQASYNDMTFATSLWASVWVFWFTTRMNRDEPSTLMRRAAFLSRSIASMILLGGAVGKWTPEYWSGEVFYDIYFLERDYWVFNYLREQYDAESLRTIATWYSRKVIALETFFGFTLWLFPPKVAAALGVWIFFSIALLSNHLLYSVLASMIGLSAVGFFARRR